MTDASPANSPSASSIPADDPGRALTVADPDGAGVPHISVAGGTYTILVSGEQTAGRYCLVDMLVPAGGGPPPHRHDFEEMFTLLEGELEFTFRGKSYTRARRIDRQRSGQRPARVQERVRQDGPYALHVYAGRTGRILPGGRISRRRSHIATAEADPRTDGREKQTDCGAAAKISHRDGEDVRRDGRDIRNVRLAPIVLKKSAAQLFGCCRESGARELGCFQAGIGTGNGMSFANFRRF